jgi:hypothetical protein
MDARDNRVSPTPPPNLRRVRLRPAPVTPETNARGQNVSPASSTPNAPRFARTKQMSAFEPFEENPRVEPNDVPGASRPAARVALEAGLGAPPGAEPERGPPVEAPPFSRKGKDEQKSSEEGLVSSQETAAVHPHDACLACAEKDAAITHLTTQLWRLRGFLSAVETLAERQAERETSSEHDLSRLERKLLAYREALRKCAGTSPESSSEGCPSPSPWRSRGGDERASTGCSDASRGRFPRVASEDQLGLHKVHGGTRYRVPSPPGTGTGTGTGTGGICGEDADEGTMRE